MIGDTGVDVHAAVVGCGLHVVTHVGRLWVLPAKERIVIGGAWRLHRSERDTVYPRSEQPGTDQPICLCRSLLGRFGELLYHLPKAVRDRLGDGSRLIMVREVGLVLGHAMR